MQPLTIIPLNTLSDIASYILLQQVAPLLRQKIAEKVEDSRVLSGSAPAQSKWLFCSHFERLQEEHSVLL